MFLSLPPEVRLLIYKQALAQDHEECPCCRHTNSRTLLDLAAVCQEIRREVLPVLEKDSHADTEPTPIQITANSVKILGKNIPTRKLVRFTPPTMISLTRNWLLQIEIDCFLAHPPANFQHLPQIINPNFPAAPMPPGRARARLIELQQEASAWVSKGLEWTILQLQVDPAALPQVSVELTCAGPLHYPPPQPLGCRWVSPDPDSVSISTRNVLELDDTAHHHHRQLLAFDVGELLEDCANGIQWPSYSQRLWWSAMARVGGEPAAVRRGLLRAWKWLGVDNRKFARKMERAMEGG
ncbi:MAG: hypothetical protein Q9208_004328 [Pyrenodesmia sp. 3 TL-2023]